MAGKDEPPSGGNSHQRAKRQAKVQKKAQELAPVEVEKTSSLNVPHHEVSRPSPPVNLLQRLLNFLEQPLVTLALGIIGGMVGIFVYAPVLILCGLSILLGFHRARVVSGYSRRWKVIAYLLLTSVISVGLYGLQIVIQRKPHPEGHTHVDFLPFILHGGPRQFKYGDEIRLDVGYTNVGDYPSEDGSLAAQVFLRPYKTAIEGKTIFREFLTAKPTFATCGTFMPHTQRLCWHSYFLRLASDVEADRINTGDLSLCVAARAKWRDTSGHYNTDSCQCLLRELGENGPGLNWHFCDSHNGENQAQ